MPTNPEQPLVVESVVHDDVYGGNHRYLAPLLTCGHYGAPIFECSSDWDCPDEAHVCPVCGQERQMDLRIQAAILSEWEAQS